MTSAFHISFRSDNIKVRWAEVYLFRVNFFLDAVRQKLSESANTAQSYS